MDTDFVIAGPVEANLARVNYDANVGQAGSNVKIAIFESGIDKNHPTFAGRMIIDPLSPPNNPEPSDVLHGTKVAMLATGGIDKQAYGVAYRSDIEFVDAGGIVDEFLSALEYLGATSDAFVANFSGNYVAIDRDSVPFLIEDQDNCESAYMGLDSRAFCSVGSIIFSMNQNSLVPTTVQPIFNACVNPGGAAVNSDGTKERICVISSSDFGLQESGWIYGTNSSEAVYSQFEVATLLGDDSFLFEAGKQALRDALYVRGGVLNLPEEDARYAGHYIVVAGLEQGANRLSRHSNACGDAMMHCLSVPYSQAGICMTDPSGVCGGTGPSTPDPYGSDFSAPIVSGAAAVLKSTYPHLSAPSVVSILLETATDIGPRGTDKDFGRGRLNILGSLQPVGEKLTSAGESQTETVIKAGPSLESAFARSTASFGLFDSHKRPYLHYVSERVTSQGSALDALDGFMRDSSALVNTDVRQRMGLLGTGETRAPAAVVLRSFDDDSSLRIDSGFDDCSLGCLSSRDVKASSLVPSSARAWSEQHVSVPFGRMGTVVEVGFANDADYGFSSGGLFYAGRLGESSLLRLEAGALVERETFMGSSFGGALELGAGRGQYVSAQLGTELGAGAFSASYTLGKERAGKAIGSLVTEVSDATYDGYRLAYGGEGWEFHHTVPLAATGGGMRIESVGGYTGDQGDWSIIDSGDRFAIVGSSGSDDWSYRTDSHWIDFSAAGRERRTGVVLNRPFGAWDSVFALEHVSNSPREGHVGGEARVAVGLELDFD